MCRSGWMTAYSEVLVVQQLGIGSRDLEKSAPENRHRDWNPMPGPNGEVPGMLPDLGAFTAGPHLFPKAVLDERFGLLARIESVRPVGFCCCGGMRKERRSTARDRVLRDAVYLSGREPAMSMSTSLLALCCQSAPEPTCETPISARSRSYASRSLRRSPLFLARFTSPSIAAWIMVREPS